MRVRDWLNNLVDSKLSITSVCRTLPTPDDPAAGLFVMRRLAAMDRQSKHSIVQPIPYFPLVRPLPRWARASKHVVGGVDIAHAPMFYLPKFLKYRDGYWLYRSAIETLTALKDDGNLDLIDAHFAYPDGVGCVRVAKELGVPVVITLRGVEEDYMRIPSIARQIGRALALADGCICVSQSLKELAVKAGAKADFTQVIHNAVDRRIFALRDKIGSRSGIGFPKEAPLIVSVGNLLSVKRHSVLISAFEKLGRELPEARLVIIGGAMHEPGYPRELLSQCENLGISDRVTFTGMISEIEVANWLNSADVFALASRREGCCNAVLEALACGLPVVVTSVGDNPHFVQDGHNGYLVPVDDRDAMARALLRAIERQDWDRNRISAELKVGDWDSVAEEILRFFKMCIGQHRKVH